MTVILIGPPAAGKTRLGKRVAKRLGTSFIDTDSRVVKDHGPIADIFREHGEAYFRALERAEVERALREDAVVALGGGAILDEQTQSELQGRLVALITARPDAVEHRIGDGKRPLLAGGIESWKSVVAARSEIYSRLATREWDTSDRPLSEIAREIAAWVIEEKS